MKQQQTKEQLELERTRRFRYAVGYVIEQEGTEPVERLVRDGTRSRFGVRNNWVPGTDLDDLTRFEAERLLRDREWQFHNYDQIDALTVPTKIFDTHIVFDPDPAITLAQSALRQLGFDLSENGNLDRSTRRAIEEVDGQSFFPEYIEELEFYVNENFGGRSALIRRVQNLPYRNVDASATTL